MPSTIRYSDGLEKLGVCVVQPRRAALYLDSSPPHILRFAPSATLAEVRDDLPVDSLLLVFALLHIAVGVAPPCRRRGKTASCIHSRRRFARRVTTLV